MERTGRSASARIIGRCSGGELVLALDSIGVAGCGAMGKPMAKALIHNGYSVVAYDIRPASEFAELRRYLAPDPASLSAVDALICVVRDRHEILDLCFNDQAVFREPPYPPVLIVSSTVSPRFIRELRALLPADVGLVDAPMSGAPIAAEERRLSFMVGGNHETVEQCMPLFQSMGKQIFTVGQLGQGMAAKVFNNFVAASSVVAVRQALAMAADWDLGDAQMLEIMRASSGATWYGDNFDRIDWACEGYSPTNTLAILIKDVTAALDATPPKGDAAQALADALLEAIKTLPPCPGVGE